MKVDLSLYQDRIVTPEDKVLFNEALLASKAGAYRAAYILLWITCAESLKRRFREASKRDNTATMILGEIERGETEKKAIDSYLLNKSKEYGFVSEVEFSQLEAIYKNRCIYGHPYELAPTGEEVQNAASLVIRHVLSKPTKLRHGYMSAIIKNLFEDNNYLDNTTESIDKFANEVANKFDETLYNWMFKVFAEKLQIIESDYTVRPIYNRGRNFLRAILDKISPSFYCVEEWKDFGRNHPLIMMSLFNDTNNFKKIDNDVRDYLVGLIITNIEQNPTYLNVFIRNKTLMNVRQKNRINEKLRSIHPLNIITILRETLFDLSDSFEYVIKALKSKNWYAQGPAVNYMISKREEIKALTEEQQVELGRNLLQAAEGDENSSKGLLYSISQNINEWPINFIEGIVFECFFNEEKVLRFKLAHINNVIAILVSLEEASRNKVISYLNEGILSTTSISYRYNYEFYRNTLLTNIWFQDIDTSLMSKGIIFASV